MTVRDQSIDIAKGLAIIAIVLGHVLRGLSSSGIIDGSSPLFMQTDRVLYMGHLVVFAFLSGLFVSSGVNNRGSAAYLRPRLALFLYLYVVWQVLQVVVKFATGALVNSPVNLGDMLRLWKPEGQLWFLPFLIIVTLGAAVTKPWRHLWVLAPAAVVSVVAWGFDGGVAGMQGIALFLPFFLGTAVGADRILRLALEVRLVLVVSVLAGSVAAIMLIFTMTSAIPPTVNTGDRGSAEIAWGVLASATALVAVLAAARTLALLGAGRILAFFGRRSMEIFLAHIIAASGCRIILKLAGIEGVAIHIVIGTLAGVLLPLALWAILQRLHFPWLFQAPPALLGTSKKAVPVQGR